MFVCLLACFVLFLAQLFRAVPPDHNLSCAHKKGRSDAIRQPVTSRGDTGVKRSMNLLLASKISLQLVFVCWVCD